MAEAKLIMVIMEKASLNRIAGELIDAKGKEVRERVERGEKGLGIGEVLAEGNGYEDGVLDFLKAIFERSEADD